MTRQKKAPRGEALKQKRLARALRQRVCAALYERGIEGGVTLPEGAPEAHFFEAWARRRLFYVGGSLGGG